jgi:hypothetical protein
MCLASQLVKLKLILVLVLAILASQPRQPLQESVLVRESVVTHQLAARQSLCHHSTQLLVEPNLRHRHRYPPNLLVCLDRQIAAS